MITLALAFEVCLAGFLLYPVFTGFYTWNGERSDRLGALMVTWSLAAAAMLLVSAACLWPELPATALGPLLTLRHLFGGLTLVLFLLVMSLLSGHVPKLLTIVTICIVVVRAILWVSTDLVWTHTLDANQPALYGPLRSPFLGVVMLLVCVQCIFALVGRPWKSELARRALLYAVLPGIVLSAVVAFAAFRVAEYLLALVLAPPVIALQVLYFDDFRRVQRRIGVIAERETRLASFGTDVLSESALEPEFAAVTLVAEMLGSPCTYTTGATEEGEIIASETPATSGFGRFRDRDVRSINEIAVPVEVAGSTAGVLRTSVRAATEDDISFVMAVGAVLSAALNRSRAEAMQRAEALRDSLTGLPNWSLLQDRLKRLLDRSANLPVGTLCCDIQGLKEINDEFGHGGGDTVLQSIARRLEALSTERGTVARIGGDEFVLIEPACDALVADELAQRICELTDQPVGVDGGQVSVHLRVGFAVADEVGQDPDQLVRHAGMAMMLAKRDGASTAAFSDQVRDRLVVLG